MYDMDYYYDGESEVRLRTLERIEYAKSLYEAQVEKAKKEEYIRDLLLEDYAANVRANRSRYDYITNIFSKAQKQIGERLKKDRPDLETLKRFVADDFLNKDKKFKLDKIISCGYEDYAWRLEYLAYGKRMYIEIPAMSNITGENLQHANWGMFDFGVYESDHCYKVLKRSYEIEEIAEFIKNYVEGLER